MHIRGRVAAVLSGAVATAALFAALLLLLGDPRAPQASGHPFVWPSFALCVVVAVVAWRRSKSAIGAALATYLIGPYYGNKILGEAWLGSPEELSSGTVAISLVGDVLLLAAAAELGRPSARRVVVTAAILPLLLAIANGGLNLVGSFHAGPWAAQSLVLVRAVAVGAILYGTLQEREADWRSALIRDISLIGLLLSLAVFLYPYLASLSGATAAQGRASLPGWGNNTLAAALALLIAFLVAQPRPRPRLWWASSSVMLAAIVATGTRMPLAVTLVIAPLILLSRASSRSLRVLSVGLAVIGAVTFVSMAPSSLLDIAVSHERVPDQLAQVAPSEAMTILLQSSTGDTRRRLNEASYSMIDSEPLAGVGFGQWNRARYHHGFHTAVLVDAHNGYLWFASESGILGLVTLALGASLLIRRYMQLPKMLRGPLPSLMLVLGLLELTNANVSKALYAVLAASLLALSFALPRSVVQRSIAEEPGRDGCTDQWPRNCAAWNASRQTAAL